MKKSFVYISCVCVLAVSSCIKKEIAVPKHDPGNVTTNSVSMDPTYKYQLYFSLKTNSVVSKNLKTTWDLGFENGAEGYHVVLNMAKSMYAMSTGKTDFASVTKADSAGFSEHKKWDSPSGDMDSTAIGNWKLNKEVYIIDRGYNEAGVPLGFAKVQIISCDATSYTLRFANINGSDEATVTINKDDNYNLSFLSFTTKTQVEVEPKKDTWDLAFTQYTYIFYNEVPVTPYLVTGCLLNRNGTQAIKDTTHSFATIDLGVANSLTLSKDISVIGYDWKTYTGSTYVINTKFSYIIKTAEGAYYKLHFTGFYDNNGQKGTPNWEYQSL